MSTAKPFIKLIMKVRLNIIVIKDFQGQMALSALSPSNMIGTNVFMRLVRGLVKPPSSTIERQLKLLLAERQSAAEAQADAVVEAKIEATQRCLRELLKVLDAVDGLDVQAKSHPKSRRALAKHLYELHESIAMTRSLTDQVLDTLEAQRIAPNRLDIFDSSLHNAVRVIEDSSLPSNTVCETLQPGLIHKGTVIRPAQVVINDVY